MLKLSIITKKGYKMKKLKNIHPGEVLKEEFLIPMGISAYKLAIDTNMPHTRISQILREKRSISANTAIKLGLYFGNSPEFWLGLQNDFDLEEIMRKEGKEILKSVNALAYA